MILPSRQVSTIPLNFVREFYEDEKDVDIKKTMEESRGVQIWKNAGRTHRMTAPDRTRTRFEVVSDFKPQTGDDQELLKELRMEEVKALLGMACYVIVDASAAKSQRLYKSRFVDLSKLGDTKRSRLCASAHHNNDHGLFTATPAIKKPSIRILIVLCISEKLNVHKYNVTRAFLLKKSTRDDPFSCKHQRK